VPNPPGQIIWTATPNGWSTASDGSSLLKLSLVVTPHPVSSQPNATFGDLNFSLLQN
jgi:hypothetical protein